MVVGLYFAAPFSFVAPSAAAGRPLPAGAVQSLEARFAENVPLILVTPDVPLQLIDFILAENELGPAVLPDVKGELNLTLPETVQCMVPCASVGSAFAP